MPMWRRRTSGEASVGALSDTQDGQVAACCPVAHLRADALGDRVEQGITDVAVKPPVYRHGAEEIGEAVPIEPLNSRVPAHDRRAEQAAGVFDQSPAFACHPHLVLERRMTPAGVAGGKSLMQIGGLGVYLRLTRPADNNVAEQRHPSPGMEQVMRPAPANGRVDPVPRRRGHQDIEAPSAAVPLLERRILDLDVAEGGEPLASQRGHARAGLDGGYRVPEPCQRARRLTG